MRMSRRRNSLKGFGLIDTFVGLLIVAVAAAVFGGVFRSIDRVAELQGERIPQLLEEADGKILESSL